MSDPLPANYQAPYGRTWDALFENEKKQYFLLAGFGRGGITWYQNNIYDLNRWYDSPFCQWHSSVFEPKNPAVVDLEGLFPNTEENYPSKTLAKAAYDLIEYHRKLTAGNVNSYSEEGAIDYAVYQEHLVCAV